MIAIITGDIVGSGSIEPMLRKKLFEDTDRFLNSLQPVSIESYETYRGDSLQCAAQTPALSLRIALLLRAFFRSYISPANKMEEEKSNKGYFSTDFDIRLAIGIGNVDFIKKNNITLSDGEAFRLSGEGLDILKESNQRLIIKTSNPEFDEQIEPAIILTDSIIQKWTQNQAAFALYKLMQFKDDEIAEKLSISQPAVTQRKKTAQWYGIEKLLNYFEKSFDK